MLKPNAEIDELGDESDDICEKGLLDHFSQRPIVLEDICLAEFASMYEFKRAFGKSSQTENQDSGEKINGN
jgi:hypothetical protein